MKRRDVLKQAAATAAIASVGAGAAGAGCATVPRPPTPHDDRAAADYLAQLDHSLALAATMRPVHEIARARETEPRSPVRQQWIDDRDAMFRRLVSTLFVTQSFRDLPPETQIHPAVQARIASHLDEVDGTIFELSNFLAAQTTDERTQLRDALRNNPRAGMDVAELLDGRAAAMGVTAARRRQLRQIMTQATFRLRTESPGALIDECTAKVERLRGEDGNSALALALAQQVGERQFWRYQHHLAQSGYTSGPPATTAGPAPATAVQPPGVTPPQAGATRKPGDSALKVGGYMMGIGVVDLAVGAVIISNNATGVLLGVALVGGITIGAVLVAVGFITVIIGALIRASSD